jgi:hypothetical protein
MHASSHTISTERITKLAQQALALLAQCHPIHSSYHPGCLPEQLVSRSENRTICIALQDATHQILMQPCLACLTCPLLLQPQPQAVLHHFVGFIAVDLRCDPLLAC